MDVFLLTHFFPYKRSEPFLVNELPYIKQNATSISVITMYGDSKDALCNDLHLFDPLFRSPNGKITLFLKGLLNTSGFKYHFREFITERLFLHPKKLYWFFISLLITRTALSSKSYNDLINSIEAAPNPILYFYWCDDLVWVLPYLKDRLKQRNVKTIVRFHRTDLYEWLKADYAPLRKVILEKATWLCPVSENGTAYLQQRYPKSSTKLITARLGVKDNGVNPFSVREQHHVVSISYVVPTKRVHLIFLALQACRQKIVWHHFGDGPLLDELKAIVETHRPGLDVMFHGHVNNSTIIDFFKKTPVSLFMNVSSSEGLPVSIMEALSFGIPVVATNVGGVGELVSDFTGKLVPAEIGTKELAAVVEEMLGKPVDDIGNTRKNARRSFFEKVNADINYRHFYEMLKK